MGPRRSGVYKPGSRTRANGFKGSTGWPKRGAAAASSLAAIKDASPEVEEASSSVVERVSSQAVEKASSLVVERASSPVAEKSFKPRGRKCFKSGGGTGFDPGGEEENFKPGGGKGFKPGGEKRCTSEKQKCFKPGAHAKEASWPTKRVARN